MTEKNTLATQVVQYLMEQDKFSQWLGIQLLDSKEGYSRIQMTVREEMTNGFGIAHGGIAFSLADSAFAFACNSRNNLSVALDTSINFTKAIQMGDILTAEAKEKHNGRSTGLYFITIINQHNDQVAFFKGTCFRKNTKLINK